MTSSDGKARLSGIRIFPLKRDGNLPETRVANAIDALVDGQRASRRTG